MKQIYYSNHLIKLEFNNYILRFKNNIYNFLLLFILYKDYKYILLKIKIYNKIFYKNNLF